MQLIMSEVRKEFVFHLSQKMGKILTIKSLRVLYSHFALFNICRHVQVTPKIYNLNNIKKNIILHILSSEYQCCISKTKPYIFNQP